MSKWRAKKEFFEIPTQGMAEEQNLSFPVIRLISTVITRIKRVEFPVRRGVIDVSAVDGFCRVAALDRRGKWIAVSAMPSTGEGPAICPGVSEVNFSDCNHESFSAPETTVKTIPFLVRE